MYNVSGLWATTQVLCQLPSLFILNAVYPDAAEAFLEQYSRKSSKCSGAARTGWSVRDRRHSDSRSSPRVPEQSRPSVSSQIQPRLPDKSVVMRHDQCQAGISSPWVSQDVGQSGYGTWNRHGCNTAQAGRKGKSLSFIAAPRSWGLSLLPAFFPTVSKVISTSWRALCHQRANLERKRLSAQDGRGMCSGPWVKFIRWNLPCQALASRFPDCTAGNKGWKYPERELWLR